MTATYICGMAGAIYCCTDMIIMEKYKEQNKDNFFLKVTVTIDDVVEKSATYEMNNLPNYIKRIYDYVSETSVIEYDYKNKMYTLYGDHICRARDYKFALGKFSTNPLAQDKTYTLENINSDDVLDEVLVDISQNLKPKKI